MRYRAGWLVPDRVLALTHFEPLVTPEDFRGIAAAAADAVRGAAEPYHLLIDNRAITDLEPVPLRTMLESMPVLRHPQLRWIVVVLPEQLAHTAAAIPIQQDETVRLRYVDTLAAAWLHLTEADPRLTETVLDDAFFRTH